MRKLIPALALVLALMLLGCAALASGTLQRDPMATPDTTLPDGYDPASEEDGETAYVAGAAYDAYGRQMYAGATPIPLDPIDMPTATPRPSLAFSYGVATVDSLNLTFEAPVGWGVDTSVPDAVTLIDPNTYDNYNASMTIRIVSVSSSYKLADVKTEVRTMLSEIGKYDFAKWETTDLALRTLLKKDGYYANYRGEYYDGTVVRGRVMVALLDGNKIITVHMACPGWYNESYMNVVSHFRDTVKLTK